jgi:tetratricopeptide (TPR) repeat protein
LDQDVERFALECLGVPHADLFPQVWDHWQRVEQLLDRRQSLGDRAHLTLLGGQLTYFLSRLSFNMGGYTAARRHAALAWQYAENVGQAVLCASVKTLQGTIAFYAGQHRRALDYLQAAERHDNPYNRPRVAANRARVYAVLGEPQEAEQALATMERHLVDLPVQPGDSPYTTATGMSALVSTLVWLGDGEVAEDYARQSVALHNRQTVQHELLGELAELGPFPSLEVAQELVDAWVEDYNLRRPHQALGMATPAERFQPSQRRPGGDAAATGQRGAAAAGDGEVDVDAALALWVPTALDADHATSGNGDHHDAQDDGRGDAEQTAGTADLQPGPDGLPDGRAALDLAGTLPAGVLVAPPVEVERYVHDSGQVRAFRQAFTVGAQHRGELVRVRLEGRVLHVLDAHGRLLRSVPRDPSKEGGSIPARAKRLKLG